MKAGHFASIAAWAALSTVMVDAGGSKAAIFNIGGQDYDVTTFTGSYNGNITNFNTLENGGVMPWWGDQALAAEFATTVAGNLGYPNFTTTGSRSPYFGYKYEGRDSPSFVSYSAWRDDNTLVNAGITTAGSSNTWAQARLILPASVPGPLPIFGAATALVMSRRLRHRISSQSNKL